MDNSCSAERPEADRFAYPLVDFTKQVAIQNAEYGIGANVILPGLIDTQMAVDTRAQDR